MIADFIAEFTLMEGQRVEPRPQWSIYMDRSSNKQTGEANVVFHSSEGDKVKCMVCLDFPTTNNEVEYEALIAGLDLAKAAGAANMVEYCDSQVMTSQVNEDYDYKNE